MKIKGRSKNIRSFPFLDIFSLFIFYLLNDLSPTLFFFLKCLSVLFCIPFLWLSLSFLYYFIFPPWSKPTFPTTCMQQPVLPYQERVHNQPSSRREQGRLAPIPQWKQVKKLIMNTMHCLHPMPAITVLFWNQSFSSTFCESIILNNLTFNG